MFFKVRKFLIKNIMKINCIDRIFPSVIEISKDPPFTKMYFIDNILQLYQLEEAKINDIIVIRNYEYEGSKYKRAVFCINHLNNFGMIDKFTELSLKIPEFTENDLYDMILSGCMRRGFPWMWY